MKESTMMWVIIVLTPLALWMTVPSYIEEIQQGPARWSQTTPRG